MGEVILACNWEDQEFNVLSYTELEASLLHVTLLPQLPPKQFWPHHL